MLLYCDEIYTPNHRFKSSCLLLIGEEEIEELLKENRMEKMDRKKRRDHPQKLALMLWWGNAMVAP